MKYGIRQLVSVVVCTGVLLGVYPLAAEEPTPDPALLQRIRDRRDLPLKRAQRTKREPVAQEAISLPEIETPAAPDGKNLVSMDFNDVDLAVFIKFVSEITGKNFVLDQNVRTKVTVISPSKIPVEEAYRVFESVLEVHGFATVEAGDIIKVVKAGDARSKNIETGLVKESRTPDDKLVTQIIPLRYADANEIKGLFTPLVSKDSVLLAYPSTNMLILTDVYSNIQRLMRILDAIDVTGIGRQVSVIPLEYADASKMVSILEVVFREAVDRGGPPQRGGTEPTDKIRLVADDRANVVIMLASESETVKIRKLITLLDKKVQQGKERIHVYYLKNADAEELAKVLQMLPEKQGDATADGKKLAPVLSKAINITADASTNSLIIMAERDDYLVLKEIIERLDIPRSMVYIECLIAEVNINKDFELGAEWLVGGKGSYDDKDGGYAVGFGGASDMGYTNVARVAQGGLPSGFSVGAMAESIVIGGIEYPNLAAVVRAFKKDKDVQILSTPQIMTTDNQEATITVGKNIPYLTKIGTTSSEETYSNYEYKDVGISLKIKPQINENRLIRLDIEQELTKLDQLTTVSMDRPATLKRGITTNVIVHDEHTIVIGGLIDDSMSRVEYKVPCLGDIPFLGWLFKGVSNSSEKTNLLVFLTPHVIKTAREADDIYRSKQSDLDAVRGGSFSLYSDDVEDASAIDVTPVSSSDTIPADEAETDEGEDEAATGIVVIEGDGVDQPEPMPGAVADPAASESETFADTPVPETATPVTGGTDAGGETPPSVDAQPADEVQPDGVLPDISVPLSPEAGS